MKDLIPKEHDILTTSMVKSAGFSKYKFYRFLRDNDYEQIGHGVYASKDAWVDELKLLSKRCPQAVFSHDEAFYFHELTDREPLTHTLTIYSGYNAHRLVADGIKVYTVKKELLNIGRIIVVDHAGNDVPMYDLERTVCDLIRSRSSIEIQDFSSVLKTYVSRKDKNLNRLMEYAKLFRVEKILRKYMEVLL